MVTYSCLVDNTEGGSNFMYIILIIVLHTNLVHLFSVGYTVLSNSLGALKNL
jgi:hypothetical protein